MQPLRSFITVKDQPFVSDFERIGSQIAKLGGTIYTASAEGETQLFALA